MILKLSEKNVFVVDIDTDCRDKNSWFRKSPKNKFSEYFITRPFLAQTPFPTGHAYGTYAYYSNKWGGSLTHMICAIYLGDAKTLNDAMDTKYTSPNFQTIKKLYFDPNCKYPRFKLSETTNIKRCLDPSKADCVVMTKQNFTNSKFGTPNNTNLSNPHEVTVLYSPQEDVYYIIPVLTNVVGDLACTNDFQNKINKYSKLKATADPSDKLLDAMKNAQIIAFDSKIIYTGKIFAISDEDILTTVEGLLNNYMLITYDTDLDKFVSQGLQQITDEDVKALSKMLSSPDDSVKGMGVKLLSNYDIQSAPLTAGSLIIKNFANISGLNEIKSVGFKQVLSTLKLDIDRLKYSSRDEMLGNLYSISTNETEKTMTRNMLSEQLTEELKYAIEQRISKLSAFGFNIELKIT